MKRQIYRQGDVLLIATELPAIKRLELQPVPRRSGRLILADGEVTGHAHAILDETAELVTADQAAELYLLVHGTSPVALVHEEHTTIPVPPGEYQVLRQTEYSPQELRTVTD